MSFFWPGFIKGIWCSPSGGFGSLVLPFYLANGTYSPIGQVSGTIPFYDSTGALNGITVVSGQLPFYLSSGTQQNIALV